MKKLCLFIAVIFILSSCGKAANNPLESETTETATTYCPPTASETYQTTYEIPEEPIEEKNVVVGIDICDYTELDTYGYNSLTEDQKMVFDTCLNGVKKIIENDYDDLNKLYFEKPVPDKDLRSSMETFYITFPQLNVFLTSYFIAISSDDYVTIDGLQFLRLDSIPVRLEEYNLICSIADEVMSSLVHDGTTYGKVCSIANWIMDNAEYPDNYSHGPGWDYLQSPIGVFSYNEVTCQGYAETFDLMCKKAGIDSLIVSGDSIAAAHAWNMVCIDNKWYHVDLTWEDSNSDCPKRYMFMPEELCAIDHKNIRFDFCDLALPKATSYDLFEYYFESANDVLDHYSKKKLK